MTLFSPRCVCSLKCFEIDFVCSQLILCHSVLKTTPTLSLDLCPCGMGCVVGQASFLFQIPKHFLPILEVISV